MARIGLLNNLKLAHNKSAGNSSNNCPECVCPECNCPQTPPAPDTPQEMLEAEELKTMLQTFLDCLSVENRVIFLRRYWFCDTYADIARQVGLTEKNVSVRLSRMRADLRRYLQKGGVAL